MLQLISAGLLKKFGINVETAEVTATVKREGDEVSLTIVPKPDEGHFGSMVDFVRGFMGDLADGVTYVATGNNTGPTSLVILADGVAIDDTTDPAGNLARAFKQAIGTCVNALNAAKRTFDVEVDLGETVATASVSSLQAAVREGRTDLLVPGVRPVTCHCGGCGRDRNGRSPSVGLIGVVTPTFTCGNAYFDAYTEAFEGALRDAFSPEAELAQLRRLKIELAEAGLDIAVTLPDGDTGEPWDGTVLYAEPPPEPSRESRGRGIADLAELLGGGRVHVAGGGSLEGVLGGLLDGRVQVISIGSLDDLDLGDILGGPGSDLDPTDDLRG